MVLIVILLPALFALSALAINIAYMEAANTEIQIAADAAVRAAGRTYALTGDKSLALADAREAAARNPIGTYVLPIAAGDLEFGVSTRTDQVSGYEFTSSGAGKGNSVRLSTNSLSSGSAAGIDPVFPFFGSGFKIRPLRTATSTQGVIDIALVVDRSGSMAYASDELADYPPAPANAPPGWDFDDPCPPGARWLDLIAAVKTFRDELDQSPQEELLALSTYNHESATPVKLSTDYQVVIDELVSISTNFSAGGTAVGRGIHEGIGAVFDPNQSRDFASKVIVVMTDGVHNYGSSPYGAAETCANRGVTLFTVTFSDEADQALMQDLAERSGGQHFHAVTAAQLKQAFQDIARSLPTLLTQ